MAGHSKWANIKHRKAGQDAKRGKIFTKLIRELVVAAKEGGADLDSNPRLRAGCDKAFSNNMKKDTIDKAIARGSGQLEGANYENIRYEGYGPSGVAMMVDCLTDNRQRAVAEIRHAFSKLGGNLGTDGSVSYLFQQKGVILLSSGANEDEVFELALESGAEDVQTLEDGSIEIVCAAADLASIKQQIEQNKLSIEQAETTFIADTQVDLDLETTLKVLNLIDKLEDLDDVQQVHTNLQISDEIAAQLEDS